MNSFYSQKEIGELGFKSIGENVLISRNAKFYGISNIIIGNHVRIDDFCILSGNIKLGSYIHISTYCVIYGQYGVELEDFTGLSPRCTIFSATDDFSGDYMISPMVSDDLTNVTGGKVHLKRFVQVGAGCIILPNVTLENGVAIGTMSLVNKSMPEWTICYGIPAHPIKGRNRRIIESANKNYGV